MRTQSIIKSNPVFRAAAYAGLMLLISGCALAPAPERSDLEVDIPSQWPAEPDGNQIEAGAGRLADFSDSELDALVREALERNLDFRITATRLDNARAAARMAGANRLPELSVGIRADRGETKTVMEGEPVRTETKTHGLGMDMSWEIDLWGRLRDQANAAGADLAAAEADIAAARLSLAAGVAKAWLNTITARLQLELASETAGSYAESARKVQGGFDTGTAGALDLRLALAEAATARDLKQQREMELVHAVRYLQVLLGRYPDGRMAVSENLPELRQPIPPGLPSALLRRRPDIRAAEHRLAAADGRVKAAKKIFFPRISLTSGLGTAGEQLKDLVDLDYSLWNLAGNLVQPVFQGGRLEAGLLDAETDARRAWLQYNQTVLHAFREVEAALADALDLKTRETILYETVRQLAGAGEMAMAQYESGVSDIIMVLEAQRRVLDARVAYLDIRNARLKNRVDIHLALGGDFGKENQK